MAALLTQIEFDVLTGTENGKYRAAEDIIYYIPFVETVGLATQIIVPKDSIFSVKTSESGDMRVVSFHLQRTIIDLLQSPRVTRN